MQCKCLRTANTLVNANCIFCVVVVVLGYNVLPTAQVIRRLDLDLKSHPKDWKKLWSNPRTLVYKANTLITKSQRLPYISGDRSLCRAATYAVFVVIYLYLNICLCSVVFM